MSPREIATAIIGELGRRTASLDYIEGALARLAPEQFGDLAAVLNYMPGWMQPRLHRDADALVAVRGGSW